tara:strand:- start:122 stop:268 length:147 start_codon:yes stop_codon:yes gene_type:complete
MSVEMTKELLELLIESLSVAIGKDEINCEYHEVRSVLRLMEDLNVLTP